MQGKLAIDDRIEPQSLRTYSWILGGLTLGLGKLTPDIKGQTVRSLDALGGSSAMESPAISLPCNGTDNGGVRW